jgi:MinD superfamily P-loop ATPase
MVDPLDCEGCGYCHRICPSQAIEMVQQKVGQCHVSDTRIACRLVHARLGIGADNSGKLVAKVKKEARKAAGDQGREHILVDGSPGIGCPVISSLSGADFVLLVTEPTLSGFNDLQRVWQLTARFHIPAGCIINKSDLNPLITDQIRAYLAENGIVPVDEITYDEDFSRAITQGQSLVELNPSKWQDRFSTIWKRITNEVQT